MSTEPKYVTPTMVEQAFNSLLGILRGMAIDGVINPREIVALQNWATEQSQLERRPPFSDLVYEVRQALADGKITAEEKADIFWAMEQARKGLLQRSPATAGIQELQGVLSGIAADDEITELEVEGLRQWMEEHEELRYLYPYTEVSALVADVMRDRKIDADEHKHLLRFFADFANPHGESAPTLPVDSPEYPVREFAASPPNIVFKDRLFCFTGRSSRVSRAEMAALIAKLGGRFTNTISKEVDFLVVGSDGSMHWTYACFGRKVEEAIDLQKMGEAILLVQEAEFWEAVRAVAGDAAVPAEK